MTSKISSGQININSKDTAFNVWLKLLDELLDKKTPLTQAMMHAGQALQEKQNASLFHPVDLYRCTQDVNLLLRRRPEYTQREEGWAKEKKKKWLK